MVWALVRGFVIDHWVNHLSERLRGNLISSKRQPNSARTVLANYEKPFGRLTR